MVSMTPLSLTRWEAEVIITSINDSLFYVILFGVMINWFKLTSNMKIPSAVFSGQSFITLQFRSPNIKMGLFRRRAWTKLGFKLVSRQDRVHSGGLCRI
jgi:hypothetical protein